MKLFSGPSDFGAHRDTEKIPDQAISEKKNARQPNVTGPVF